MFLVIAGFVFLSDFSYSSARYPKDVSEYLETADRCQYLSGEWDSTLPDERKIALEKDIDVTCGKASGRCKSLKEKYRGRKELLKVIDRYDF